MNSNPLSLALVRLSAGESLSADESQAAVARILTGGESEATIAAFLTALTMKGETADELLGAVRAIRERMIPIDCGPSNGECLDTCGTGGDGASTVNVSTATAIVVAACKVPVIKHGNRAASGRSGSSDVLERLGVSIDIPIDRLCRCLAELGIAFLFAPNFHPGLKAVAPVRRQLPFRTVFNLVGPLCNPASPGFQLVGVPHQKQVELMADVLARIGHLRRALIVTGHDGLDEVALDGPTRVRIIEAGQVREDVWNAEDFGLKRVSAEELRVSGPEESAACLMRTFAGEPGPVREIVLANSAAALWVVEPCPLGDAVRRAAQAIDSGAAAHLLRKWRELTQG